MSRNTPLRARAELVLTGSIPGQPAEPLAWTYVRPGGGKTSYVALVPSDFAQPAFTRLLRKGNYWAAGVSRPEPTREQTQLASGPIRKAATSRTGVLRSSLSVVGSDGSNR